MVLGEEYRHQRKTRASFVASAISTEASVGTWLEGLAPAFSSKILATVFTLPALFSGGCQIFPTSCL